ncbi:chymotrypsin-2-like [Phymastichus coffea]|uniref:chymotrypsin-2-like n=1 Tax=Phymastichus coffea TaxID=108790 RepID=UPI00273BB641|nr:chymotrypsin-2-like [Phymastichus coffea]
MMKHVVYILALFAVAFAEDHLINRVKGGRFAAPGELPYQVSVWHYGRHICGGALITTKHVATSASCVLNFIRNPPTAVTLQVLVGTTDQTKGGILHYVAKIAAHPEYRWSYEWASYENDIVVLHLANHVTETDFVKRIKLPNVIEIPPNSDVVFSGWGGMSPNSYPVPYLMKANLRYISTEECQRYYPEMKIKNYQLCTAPNFYVGACSTDVGGPLVYNGTLVGVGTGLLGCGTVRPDVFTKVSYYLQFIITEISS